MAFRGRGSGKSLDKLNKNAGPPILGARKTGPAFNKSRAKCSVGRRPASSRITRPSVPGTGKASRHPASLALALDVLFVLCDQAPQGCKPPFEPDAPKHDRRVARALPEVTAIGGTRPEAIHRSRTQASTAVLRAGPGRRPLVSNRGGPGRWPEDFYARRVLRPRQAVFEGLLEQPDDGPAPSLGGRACTRSAAGKRKRKKRIRRRKRTAGFGGVVVLPVLRRNEPITTWLTGHWSTAYLPPDWRRVRKKHGRCGTATLADRKGTMRLIPCS